MSVAAAGIEAGVDLPCQRHQLGALALGPVEPPGDVVADPAKRRSGRPPQPQPELDRDRRRLVVGKRRDVGARPRALGQERPPGDVAAQQADGAVARPELEGVGLVVGLVVLGGRDLEDGVVARPGRRRSSARAQTAVRGRDPTRTATSRAACSSSRICAGESASSSGGVSHRAAPDRPRSRIGAVALEERLDRARHPMGVGERGHAGLAALPTTVGADGRVEVEHEVLQPVRPSLLVAARIVRQRRGVIGEEGRVAHELLVRTIAPPDPELVRMLLVPDERHEPGIDLEVRALRLPGETCETVKTPAHPSSISMSTAAKSSVSTSTGSVCAAPLRPNVCTPRTGAGARRAGGRGGRRRVPPDGR